jgi:hypothetical protein
MKKIFRIALFALFIAPLLFVGKMMLFAENEPGDPFGAAPKPVSENCGPEHRYKYDVKINSKEDFINFLKDYDGKILDEYGNNWVHLDDFKDILPGKPVQEAKVNWDKVLNAIQESKKGDRTIYSLDFIPEMCAGFKLKITNDGHVSLYGCCGK